MKRLISVLMVLVLIMSAFSIHVSAQPEDKCYGFDESGSYAFFNNLTLSPSDSSIEFDWSFAKNSQENPKLLINAAVEITETSIIAGGTNQPILWGDAEITHWRHVEVVFSTAGCTVYLDGEQVFFAAGVQGRNDGFFFIAFPGDHYIDNVKIKSNGAELVSVDFSSNSVIASCLSADSSGTVKTVPQNSYYDYEPDVTTANISYIFNSEDSCTALTTGTEKNILLGDLTDDGVINARDILKMKRATVHGDSVDNLAADMNSDGLINGKDSLQLKRTATGKLNPVYKVVGSQTKAEYDTDMNSAKLTASETVTEGIDATLNLDSIDPESYKFAVITYMTPNSKDNKNSNAAVASSFGAYGNLVEYELINDGFFHSQIIDLSEISTWNGDKATLRYFTAANEGDTVYIDSVIFTATLSKAKTAAAEREAFKASYSIVDKPDPTAAIGSVDNNGNYVIRFDTEDKVINKVTNGNNSKAAFENDSLKATATAGSDPSIYLDLAAENISANTYKYIVYTYMIPTTTQRSDPPANMYFVNEYIDGPAAGYETPLFNCKKSGNYAVAIIDMNSVSTWNGMLSGLRIDYFSDCYAGDTVYIDSIVFAKDSTSAIKIGNDRVKDRNGGGSAFNASGIWNEFCAYHQYSNSNEFVTVSGTNVTLYFRYNTDSTKFTPRSLGDRLGRAITEATGYQITAEVHSGFEDLLNNFGYAEPRANVFYTITYEGKSYCIYVETIIMKDSSYYDVLDGTESDPQPVSYNTNTWFSDGLYISDSTSLPHSTSPLAAHSNHETRIVETPYGTFAVIPLWADSNSWGTIGGANFTLFRIYDDGSYTQLGTWDMAHHTSKPNIMYAADGNIYISQNDDQSDYVSSLMLYFDPSAPNSDGSYNIHGGRTNISYTGGRAPGGYGYIQPILDDTNGKIYIMASGGSNGGYLAWTIYNYNTHSWETSSSYTAQINTYRHCYFYGYSDGNRGIYLVAGRDVLLSTLGLAGTVTGADYAWDEVNLFHIPNMNNTGYTRTVVLEADYTQTYRQLYPTIANNRNGDTYLTEDGYLHILSTKFMHGTYHHDTRYQEMWHAVYDCTTPGMKPIEIYNKPIKFISPSHFYSVRMTENTDGELYIFAMPTDKSARCEIWKETDQNALSFDLVGCRAFSDGSSPSTSIIITNRRSGSTINNKVYCIYPTDSNGGTLYKFFTAELP